MYTYYLQLIFDFFKNLLEASYGACYTLCRLYNVSYLSSNLRGCFLQLEIMC